MDYFAWILFSFLAMFGHFVQSTIGDSSSDFEFELLLKTFLQPCETVYTQVHCDDDDEDYLDLGMDEECAPLETDNCDRSLRLFCHSGLCLPNCHPTLEEYDQVRGTCFRKIGANCSKSEECDQNAICERRHCRCGKNYTLEPETGKCVRSAEFGEFCDSEVICDTLGDVICLNNICQCRLPEVQFFHLKRKRCYLHVGNSCSNKLLLDTRSMPLFCPDNSDCTRILENGMIEPYLGIGADDDVENDQQNFTCKCNSGYASTLDGKACLGIYGSSCNSLHKCNTEQSFKCYSGQCGCARPKDQYFEEKLSKCVTRIGSLCEEEASCGGQWATCKKPDATDNGIRICECVHGFSTSSPSSSSDRKVCLKNHGQNCSIIIGENTIKGVKEEDEPPCNGFIGLECSNHTETCQCKDSNQFYDVKLKTCRNFEIAQRRIPVTHYDTSDREYLFHLNSNANKVQMLAELYIISLYIFLLF